MVLKFSPFHARQGADPTSGSARLRDSAACTLEGETLPDLRYTIRSMLYVESGHWSATQETLASHQDSIGNEAGMCLGINSLTNCDPIADWAIEGLRTSRPPEGNYAVGPLPENAKIRCMDGHFSIWHEGPLGADLGNNENHESLTRRRVLKTRHLTLISGERSEEICGLWSSLTIRDQNIIRKVLDRSSTIIYT